MLWNTSVKHVFIWSVIIFPLALLTGGSDALVRFLEVSILTFQKLLVSLSVVILCLKVLEQKTVVPSFSSVIIPLKRIKIPGVSIQVITAPKNILSQDYVMKRVHFLVIMKH